MFQVESVCREIRATTHFLSHRKQKAESTSVARGTHKVVVWNAAKRTHVPKCAPLKLTTLLREFLLSSRREKSLLPSSNEMKNIDLLSR